MKNKKGLTIIELLAVITLLGVLAIIAVPAVTKYLDYAEDKVYSEYEEIIRTSAENYLLENSFKRHLELSELISLQYLDILVDPEETGESCDGFVEIEENSKASNLSYNYKVCLRCKNYDSEFCDE